MTRRATRSARRRRGLTLLELMLAMALSGLILYAIGMAIDLHLRTLQQRRDMIEQSRAARAVMRLISNDLKRVVTDYEQDLSALEALGKGAGDALSALGGVDGEAAAALGLGGSVGGEESGLEESGGDESGGGRGGGTGGEASGGEQPGGGGEESGGADPGADPAMEDPALTEAEESAYTGDLIGATQLPPTPGLYGNQFQLQLDIARLPRFDEFFQQAPTQIGELTDVVSDVKSVLYYVQTPESAGLDGAQDVFGDQTVRGGLVRRQLDRAVTQYAFNSGNVSGLNQRAEIIAPEIVQLQFRYFDGLEWLMEWDSELKGGLPMAVEIQMMVRPVEELNAEPIVLDPQALQSGDVMIYRTVVRLPTAKATFGNEDPTAGLEDLGL